MKKIITVIGLVFLLSSCGLLRVHKMDIEQGNIIEPEKVNRLHTGMSEAQVRGIMGTPILVNIFDRQQLDYTYTYQAAYHDMLVKNVILTFRNGRVSQITTCNGNC